jgi:hypothetical protein
MSRAAAIDEFERAARDLCAFVDGANDHPLAERLARTRDLLLRLYAAATRLPESLHFTQGRATPELPEVVRPALVSYAEHDFYNMFYDPYDDSSVVGGSLADDVSDVLHDVAKGLSYFDAGEVELAVWEWRLLFDSHWGLHAIDALAALHRACSPFR